MFLHDYVRHMTSRVCPGCSTVADTDKSFCPECGTSYHQSPSGSAVEDYQTGKGSGTGSNTLKVLAIVGLVSYVLANFLPVLFYDYYEFGEAAKRFIGYEAITNLVGSFKNGQLWFVVMGYVSAAMLIVSSKKT